MGSILSRRQKRTVLVIGLDGAGKSAFLSGARGLPYRGLHEESSGQRVGEMIDPTVGLTLERFCIDNIDWRCWDMSGRGQFRRLWTQFFPYVDAFIFVIDATDVERVAVVRDELDRMVLHSEVMGDSPILFVLNKTDKQDEEQVRTV